MGEDEEEEAPLAPTTLEVAPMAATPTCASTTGRLGVLEA